MKIQGLRKFYFEKRLKEKQAQYCSDKKICNNSERKIMASDIKKKPSFFKRTAIKSDLAFNDHESKLKIKRNLFPKEDKENLNINEKKDDNTYESKESKDTQENSIKRYPTKFDFSRVKRNYLKESVYFRYKYRNNNNNNFNNINNSDLKLRFSSPLYINNSCYYSNYDKENEISKERCYKINCSNYKTGVNFDCDIDDLISSTTTNIENEKDKKVNENQEFKIYLEKVKNSKVSKNNLTKGALALIKMQMTHSNEAINNNIYISFVNNEDDNNGKNICFRLGKNNMCVCGHTFCKHNVNSKNEQFVSNCEKCECKKFNYIPIFPEETNEYTKAYLLDFKYDEWKAGCKCGHNWTKHDFNKDWKCEECNCERFQSDFYCGVCGNSWENHKILFETEQNRKKDGKSIGKDYEPFTQEQLDNLFK